MKVNSLRLTTIVMHAGANGMQLHLSCSYDGYSTGIAHLCEGM